ncbi:MAG: hypothetical protein V3W28_08895 [Thermoplasmata archaeon]
MNKEELAFRLGYATGWEDAAEHVRELSGERWMEGGPDSDLPPELWGAAEELQKKGQKERAGYKAAKEEKA